MMNRWIILLIISSVSCNKKGLPLEEPELMAQATITLIEGLDDMTYSATEEVIGVAMFYQGNGAVMLTISLENMMPGTSKVVHIHEGSLERLGRHWNQGSLINSCNRRSLGKVWAKPNVGDIGNVPINMEGNRSLTIWTDLWLIGSGDEKDIFGKDHHCV